MVYANICEFMSLHCFTAGHELSSIKDGAQQSQSKISKFYWWCRLYIYMHILYICTKWIYGSKYITYYSKGSVTESTEPRACRLALIALATLCTQSPHHQVAVAGDLNTETRSLFRNNLFGNSHEIWKTFIILAITACKIIYSAANFWISLCLNDFFLQPAVKIIRIEYQVC